MDLKVRLTILCIYGIRTQLMVYVSNRAADANDQTDRSKMEVAGDATAILHDADAVLPAEETFKRQVLNTRIEHLAFDALIGQYRSVVHPDSDFSVAAMRTESIFMFIRKRIMR